MVGFHTVRAVHDFPVHFDCVGVAIDLITAVNIRASARIV